jgi:hypothetical protein
MKLTGASTYSISSNRRFDDAVSFPDRDLGMNDTQNATPSGVRTLCMTENNSQSLFQYEMGLKADRISNEK